MGKRDVMNGLEGMIEFDEGYFEIVTPEAQKQELKRGRGSQCQSNVAVVAESIKLENIETGKKDSQIRYYKMKVLENHKKEGVNELVSEILDKKSIVFSDKSTF